MRAEAEQGLAAGLVNTSFQLGGAVMLAIVTAVVSSQTGGAADPADAALLNAFHPALLVIAGGALLGLVTTLTGLSQAPSSRRKNQ